MIVKIGKISKDEEEYYFAYTGNKWRQVKVKDKVWHSVKSIKYLEGELDEPEGTLIKRIFKREGKVVSITYQIYDGEELKDLSCKPKLNLDSGEVISICEVIVRNENVSDKVSLTIYKLDDKYFFESKEDMINFIINKRKREVEGKLGNELVRLRASIKVESNKAYLLKFQNKELWVPKSIAYLRENSEVELPYWYVKNNELGKVEDIERRVNEEMRRFENDLNRLLFDL
ncbi:hypothetical protein BFU36_13085 [Sulfolobus sp. A20]|uniref:hypothetical protein n=1 Tax=Sulfolobaceae TaxID=118883 RepID=UPI00084601CA|nr:MULTISPECIES: hypothetical protein [unclassified Sulfolobus]TRM75855.1 hypothetical protein DJ528_08970 [Sulfolobus sp. B5]TRM78097.1 hypothetical protein DJ532_02485 [Sulfolobus sp. A20-N-F8]TRM82485.1 hypothetical protein DJ524_00345 [Sulfolobus sp. D5]TRM85546.1 hypothetical protein DJ522_00195 [Sulfolobus sp. F3]TRM86511.1 hypothetical protein DJ529_11145 [Sulfolobus sp. C3]TRM91810.1 hypothetical protein DJ526_06545 [Sulfolobus sp. A20-N-G8]TRN01432.1 hypothetical protein DJ527_05500